MLSFICELQIACALKIHNSISRIWYAQHNIEQQFILLYLFLCILMPQFLLNLTN